MKEITEQQLQEHTEAISEKVFQIHTKWPHFRLLLEDIANISNLMDPGMTVVSLERGLLYGGVSLIAPYFFQQDFLAVDCSPLSADDRGGYNSSMVDDQRVIKIKSSSRAPIDDTGVKSASADLVLVPNLVHHIADQNSMFREIARILKPGGKIYIFESILRELHQIPDDYLRYTPYGLKNILRSVDIEPDEVRMDGGPFPQLRIVGIQALQYFPEDKREAMQRWFDEEEFPRLMQWDGKYTENKVREHTSFPVGYSVTGYKS